MKFMFSAIRERLVSRGKTAFYIAQILPPFFAAAFSSAGLGSASGRRLIWGKLRRMSISLFPPLAKMLQEHYGLTGGCAHCGASCKLLFQCPHWDDKNSRCSIYEFRPSVCRLFPITPSDIGDRNLTNTQVPCGFRLSSQRKPSPPSFVPKGVFPKMPR